MSESLNDENTIDQTYSYSLIEFIQRGKRKKVADVDIIPTRWLTYDKKRDRYLSKFLDGPYTKDDFELLEGFVKAKADPPDSWSMYTVKLKGRASELLNNLF